MKREFTEAAKRINSIESDEIKLDRQIKKVLACKPILSRILKEVVEECRELSYEEIERCIEGEVLIERVDVEYSNLDVIRGEQQEDYVEGEGKIIYDIRTSLLLPGAKNTEFVKILVNIEAQKEDTPGYDLPLRGVFYCSRMISAQLGTEFTNNADDPVKYGNLKKVYSIWISTNTAQCRANVIEKYRLNRQVMVGRTTDNPRYDLISVIIINISSNHNTEDTDNELIIMLTDLLNEDIEAKEKIKIMEEKHGIPMTREVEREVMGMTTYTAAIKSDSRAEGYKLGEAKKLIQMVNNLMESMPFDEALRIMEVTNEEYEVAKELLEQDKTLNR